MKVINNVISKKYQDQIEKMMLSLDFDWHFLDDVTYALNGENDDPKRVEFPDAKGSPGFAHMFYHKPDGVDIMSKHYLFVLPLLLSFVEEDNFELIRIKGGLLLPTGIGYNMPHIDLDAPHKVGLYYVNESDGDTVFFNKDNQVEKRVQPKKGSVVIFDGSTYHASSCPLYHNKRVVINFNYV